MRRGNIDGIVFKDDEGSGVYTPGLPVLANVEIVLDGASYTRSDLSGRFRFDDVEEGRHRVEARYASSELTYFTTPSPVDVASGASVAFGIAPSRSSLRGVVRTDAGAGLSGVVIQISGNGRRTSARTGDDGAFVAEGLRAGDYDVSVEAGSVPAGYPVALLAPQRVHVEQERPGRATFVLRPYRSIAGRARVFNRETGKYEVLSGATVELEPLKRSSITDGNGQFAFRDVPPGSYTIVARLDGREQRSAVEVAEGPTIVRDVDVALMPGPGVAAGTRVARAAMPADGTAKRTDAVAPRAEPNAPALPSVFTIEVSSAPTARYAHAMVDELRGAGHAAYLVDRQAPGGNGVYHVRVGTYATRAEADRSARTLQQSLGWRMLVMAVAPAVTSRGNATGYMR
ncbi:MAG TPA: carboxypeptidase regulatory-like domain-containing protein [Jatrophihabitantaceae bacterium]